MKKYIIGAILLMLGIVAYAQDARIAHPFLWKSYYNPAYIGSERLVKVDLGAQTTYSYKPSLFVDSHLSFEFPWATDNVSWSAGLKASDQYQGSGLLNVASISPMLSLGVVLYDSRTVHSFLQVGVEFDAYSTKANQDKMVFGDQLDPYYGRFKDISEELSYMPNNSIWDFDMSVGLYGETSFRTHSGNIILKYGASVSHVINDKIKSLYSNDKAEIYMPEIYNRTFSAHLDYVHPFDAGWNTPVYLAGYGIYQYQANMHDIQFGVYTSIKQFMLGVSCKVEKYVPNYTLSNLVFHAVYSNWITKDINFKIAYSYEFPVTQGFITETSIHSLSLHFCYDYKVNSCPAFRCGKYSRPSDAAWYEYSRSGL